MIEVFLVVEGHRLCTQSLTNQTIECWDITRGKQSTPSPLGTHSILSITPSTKYPSPWFIAFKDTPTGVYGIHSWDTRIPVGGYSNGCIRMNPEDIDSLITNYLFNQIIIEP